MKKRVNQLFVPFLILCTIGLSQIQAQNVQFFTQSLAQLENQVKQSRTPYFLYFSVLDCDACTKMYKEAFSYAPLVNYASNSYMALQVDGLDFSEGIDIATRYNVKKYPTTMIMGPDGQVRQRVEGYIDGPMMLTLLQKAVRPSDRDLANRNLNTYSPPSSRGTDQRVANNTRGGFDDPFNDRNAANRNTFDDRYNPSYNSEPNLVDNNVDSSPKDNYDFGVDKRDYLSDYLTNRSNDLKEKSVATSTSRGGVSNNSRDNDPNFNRNYADDRSGNGSQNGYYRSQDPPKESGLTIQERYNSDTYIDGFSRSSSASRNEVRNGEPQGVSRSQGDYDNEPEGSFLAHIDDDRYSSTGQRTRSQDDYSGRPVTNLDDLPDGTVLKRGPDGKWYIYDEYRGTPSDPEQNYRGGNEASRVANREREANVFANTPKSITRSVPGFAEYSPKDLTQNTFGLVIGSYVSMSELQAGIKEFMEHNNSKLWVYSEKIGTTHFFKLVMGEYPGEQQAVSDALRMGASWEDVEVVNLARLR